jgi:hypothetical protein
MKYILKFAAVCFIGIPLLLPLLLSGTAGSTDSDTSTFAIALATIIFIWGPLAYVCWKESNKL